MNLERFGNVRVFRPRFITEVDVRNACEAELRERVGAGAYTDSKKINGIIQSRFSFMDEKLKAAVRECAGREFMDLVLAQYDFCADIEKLEKDGTLPEARRRRWFELGPTLRRALKYLAESMVQEHTGKEPELDEDRKLLLADTAFCYAEQMVNLYIISDQTYSLFPDRTTLQIQEPSELEYFKLEAADANASDMENRIRIDRENRPRFLSATECPLFSAAYQSSVLDASFKSEHGISYNDCLSVIYTLSRDAEPPDKGFKIPFCNKISVVRGLSKALSHTESEVELALSGFLLTKKNMSEDQRALFKPQQEYRAYRRGMFEMQWQGEVYITWSPRMAFETYVQLVTDMTFQKCPPEWRKGGITFALNRLSNEAGKWFEDAVANNLRSFGIRGRNSFKQGIGTGNKRVLIPQEVGEIDFLGYSDAERLLVIVECKLIRGGTEPRLFRDDIAAFVNGPNSYVQKFSRKVDWVRQNSQMITEALKTERDFPTDMQLSRIAAVIVTFFPTFAAKYTDPFKCVSLVELCVAIESGRRWPYVSESLQL